MEFDLLVHFSMWFLQQRFMALEPVAVYDYGPIRSLVLYRKGQLQAELFIVAPGGGFPQEHRHPHVDSFEVHVWGAIPLTVNGTLSTPVVVHPEGEHPICLTRVRETDWHGAAVMPEGAAFLSIQHWLDGVVPTSVGLDWEGAPVSPEHALLQQPTEAP